MQRPRPLELFTLLALLASFPLGLHAQTPVSVSGELDFKTRYLFAGMPFAEGEVTQAQITVASGSFTFYGYSVYDVDASDVTEADVWGDYYSQLSPGVGLFVGAALYTFKIGGEWDPTPEVYGGLVFTGPLTPTIYFAHDFDLGDGNHAMLTLSHSVPLGTSGATLNLAGNLDYNNNYYRDGSSFSFADFSLSLGIPVGPVTISPTVLVQRAIDDDYFTDEELFGVKAAFVF
jgi:hypothetical protein